MGAPQLQSHSFPRHIDAKIPYIINQLRTTRRFFLPMYAAARKSTSVRSSSCSSSSTVPAISAAISANLLGRGLTGLARIGRGGSISWVSDCSRSPTGESLRRKESASEKSSRSRSWGSEDTGFCEFRANNPACAPASFSTTFALGGEIDASSNISQ
jgi:hypothetical protein